VSVPTQQGQPEPVYRELVLSRDAVDLHEFKGRPEVLDVITSIRHGGGRTVITLEPAQQLQDRTTLVDCNTRVTDVLAERDGLVVERDRYRQALEEIAALLPATARYARIARVALGDGETP